MGNLYYVQGWSHDMPDELEVRARHEDGKVIGTAKRIRDERTTAKAVINVPPEYKDMCPRIAGDYVLSKDTPKLKKMYIRMYSPEDDLRLFGRRSYMSDAF